MADKITKAYDEMRRASKALHAFPRSGMGLTPDHVKLSPEYQAAKAAYQSAFAMVRALNSARARSRPL